MTSLVRLRSFTPDKAEELIRSLLFESVAVSILLNWSIDSLVRIFMSTEVPASPFKEVRTSSEVSASTGRPDISTSLSPNFRPARDAGLFLKGMK